MNITWQLSVESIATPSSHPPNGLEKVIQIQTIDWLNYVETENGVVNHNITDFKIRLFDENFIRDLQGPSFSIETTIDKVEKTIVSVFSEADEYHIILLENNEEFPEFNLYFTSPNVGKKLVFFVKTKGVEEGDEIPEYGIVKEEKSENGLKFLETELDTDGQKANALIEKSTGLIVDQNLSLVISDSSYFSGRYKLTSGLYRVDISPPEIIDLSKKGTRGIVVHAEDEALTDYEIYLNGTLVRSGNFNYTISDSYIDLGINKPDIYEVRLVVKDAFGHSAEMTEIIDFHEEKSISSSLPITLILPISAILMIAFKRNKNKYERKFFN